MPELDGQNDLNRNETKPPRRTNEEEEGEEGERSSVITKEKSSVITKPTTNSQRMQTEKETKKM